MGMMNATGKTGKELVVFKHFLENRLTVNNLNT